MWYILLLLTLVLAAKKKGGGRRRRRYLKGSVLEELAISTLSPATLVSDTWDETVVERSLISSIVVSWALKDPTLVTADGPIIVGVAHSDYSDAEIEAVLEATGSWNEGDLVAQEIAKRKVRIIGTFEMFGAAADDHDVFVLNDGKPMKTKLNWILTTGDTLKMWAYNAGASQMTGTAKLNATGHANIWPQ